MNGYIQVCMSMIMDGEIVRENLLGAWRPVDILCHFGKLYFLIGSLFSEIGLYEVPDGFCRNVMTSFLITAFLSTAFPGTCLCQT